MSRRRSTASQGQARRMFVSIECLHLVLESDAEHRAKGLGSVQAWRGGERLGWGLLEPGQREKNAVHELSEKPVFRLVAHAGVELDTQRGARARRRSRGEHRPRIDQAGKQIEAIGQIVLDRRLDVDRVGDPAQQLAPQDHVHVVVAVEAEIPDVAVGAIRRNLDAEPAPTDVALRCASASVGRPSPPSLMIPDSPAAIAGGVSELHVQVKRAIHEAVFALKHGTKLGHREAAVPRRIGGIAGAERGAVDGAEDGGAFELEPEILALELDPDVGHEKRRLSWDVEVVEPPLVRRGLNWTRDSRIRRRLKVVAVGIILLAAELEVDAIVEDGLTVLKLRLRLLLDVAARDREDEADARVLIRKGQRAGVVPGQPGGGRSDRVVIDHRGDVPTAERLGDEHQTVDRVSMVAVEAIAVVVQHSQPPMGTHPAEAQNAAPYRGADFAIDALDRDRVADRVDTGGGGGLDAGKDAEGVAVRPAVTLV